MRALDGCRAAGRAILLFAAPCVLAVSSPSAPDHPTWAVRVSSDGRNYFVDQPNCHPLAYFLKEAARLNYHHYATIHVEPGKTEDEAKLQRIGEVAGRPIEQINHAIDIDDGRFFLKIIVVLRGESEFCEIYHQEWMGDSLYREVNPASLENVGSETILVTHDAVSGNGNWYDEHYWAFGREGPIDLGVTEKIREIQKSILPKDFGVMNGGGFNLQDLTYTTPVWGPNDAHCCPSSGSVKIKFALKEHGLVVVSQSYKEN
jgi:hypothetical protein